MANKEEEKDRQINPTNMAGATKLLKAGPEAVDRAIEGGLGKFKQQRDPTYDDVRRKR